MASGGKIDPMHQFEVQTIWQGFNLGGHQIAFTNSAAWMLVTVVVLWAFMLGGMKRQVVPGRWQMMVEGFTGFVTKLVDENIGKGGRKYLPYVFSLFMFILFANLLGLLPLGLVGLHPFTFTSHFTVTGVLAIMSFSIVLIVGFWKHGFHFFSLFVPHGTPVPMIPLIFCIELVSFLVRPFSLGLRLFVSMMAGRDRYTRCCRPPRSASARSSVYPPTWSPSMKICGTVRRPPARSVISTRRAASASTSISS